ncbi:MAG: VCBS repeat-containing protein [Chloroflexaceae bacterium]|nr:VCBS repeat-containing protein [Chloroflexaceae bacterium]NJO06889.1 VCBS repeat-containing protein [Chloroflexaceae bacterium]
MAVVERPINGSWRRERRFVRPGGLVSRLLQVLTFGLMLLALMLVAERSFDIAGQKLNDWRYGFPRSATVVAYVGHGDERVMPTWIQALNLNGQISVLVAPGGDVEQLQVLQGPYLVGLNSQYEVARPAVRDVNSDGHVDLLVTVRGEILIYINEDGTFRPISAEERANLIEEGYEV